MHEKHKLTEKEKAWNDAAFYLEKLKLDVHRMELAIINLRKSLEKEEKENE